MRARATTAVLLLSVAAASCSSEEPALRSQSQSDQSATSAELSSASDTAARSSAETDPVATSTAPTDDADVSRILRSEIPAEYFEPVEGECGNVSGFASAESFVAETMNIEPIESTYLDPVSDLEASGVILKFSNVEPLAPATDIEPGSDVRLLFTQTVLLPGGGWLPIASTDLDRVGPLDQLLVKYVTSAPIGDGYDAFFGGLMGTERGRTVFPVACGEWLAEQADGLAEFAGFESGFEVIVEWARSRVAGDDGRFRQLFEQYEDASR